MNFIKNYSAVMRKVLHKEVLLTIISRVCVLVFGITSSIITAQFLGPSARGVYYYLITLANLIAQFCNFGLTSSNTYLVVKHAEYLRKLLINNFWVSCVTSMVAMVICFLIGFNHFFSSSNFFDYILIIMLAPNLLYHLLTSNLFIGIGRIKIYNAIQILSNFLICVLLVMAGLMNGTTSSMILISVFGWFASNVVMTFLLIRNTPKTNFTFDLSLFKLGFNFSIKVYIATFFGLFISRGGIFFVKHMLNMENSGYYSIALQINDVISIIPTSIAMVLFPNLIKKSKDRWQNTKINLYTTGMIMIIVCIIIGILAKPLIVLAFGIAYLPSVNIIYYMMPGAFFYALVCIASQYLSAAGNPKKQVFAWISAFVLFVTLNYALIRQYGVIGAAMALSLTFVFLFFLLFVFVIYDAKPFVQKLAFIYTPVKKITVTKNGIDPY